MRCSVPIVEQKLPAIAPLSERSPLEVLREHAWSLPPSPIIVLTSREAEEFRAKHEANFKLLARGFCVHCNSNDHVTEACFLEWKYKSFPIKSPRLRNLVLAIRKATHLYTKYPKWSSNSSLSQGEFLVTKVLPCFFTQARKILEKISPPDPEDLRGMFDAQFSQIQQKAYVWLALGVTKNLVIQMLTGFSPRWIDNQKPSRTIILDGKFSASQLQDVIKRDKEHIQANRIIEIPSQLRDQFVAYSCPRFPIYQLQDDFSEKMRVIWNGRGSNFRLPDRAFSLPTVRSLKDELVGWLISIDLSKAYHQLPMEWNARPYFAAKLKDSPNFYLYNGWPWGMKSAAFLCELIMNQVVNFLRKETGWLIKVYLDDFIFRISISEDLSIYEANLRVTFIVTIFKELGLIVNSNKAKLIPTKELGWLGFNLNTYHGKAFGTQSKFHKFMRLALTLAEADQATIKQIQEIKGLFNFFATENVRFLARPIDFTLTQAFKALGLVNPTRQVYKRYGALKVPLHPNTRQLFQVWATEIISSLSLKKIELPLTSAPTRQILIATDAAEKFGGLLYLPNLLTETRLEAVSEAQFLASLTDFSQFKEAFLPLPVEARVNPLAPKKGQPSSFFRELVILLAAIRHTCALESLHLSKEPTVLTVLTDNQSLANAFPSIKAKAPTEHKLLAHFKELLPKRVRVKVLWHPRTTPLAQRADALSKIGPMLVHQATFKRISSLLGRSPPILVGHKSLALGFLHWLPLNASRDQLLLIHPLCEPSTVKSIIKEILRSHSKGVLLTPWFPPNKLNWVIARIPTTRHYFSFQTTFQAKSLLLVKYPVRKVFFQPSSLTFETSMSHSRSTSYDFDLPPEGSELKEAQAPPPLVKDPSTHQKWDRELDSIRSSPPREIHEPEVSHSLTP